MRSLIKLITEEPSVATLESGKDLIERGEWAECFICKAVFRRRRETLRYCGSCHHGYCEGEHGSLAANARWRGPAKCIVCSTGGDPSRLAPSLIGKTT